ncbi:hypothetical protein [Paenibacillus sp. J2TS4]|uniref:hypothetical protein n=1 Tax=Paenibacillus sp. J2TS4 TaxID=2807194 RepID=UPI001B14FDF9|nr:hypothetical protein [Paenibacillus sp. J2TS4]GIP36002.1 hypothetical protein J2TS4_52120 [Paenibacillus sp. J2TS4]
MKRTKWIVIISIALTVLVTGSALYANNMPSIDEMFIAIDNQVESAPDIVIAEGPDFEVYSKDFALFKANLEFSEKMNSVEMDRTDKDIIDEIIKEALVVNLARKEGLSVSGEEIEEYITQLRGLVDDTEQDPVMKQIRDNLVKMSGLPEDEYWKSEEITKKYEKVLLIQKFVRKLAEEGKIETVDDFLNFKEKLIHNVKADIIYNSEIE